MKWCQLILSFVNVIEIIFILEQNNFNIDFFPHSVNAWGKLSKFITASSSLSVSKNRYLQFFSVSPTSIYKIRNPFKMI